MNDDGARRRFFAITAIRLTGIGLILLGLTIMVGKTSLPEWTGYLLTIAGAFDALIAPILLARRWKSPSE
jgi:hypothetical protein